MELKSKENETLLPSDAKNTDCKLLMQEENEKPPDMIAVLPVHISEEVFGYLDAKSLLAAAKSNATWRAIIENKKELNATLEYATLMERISTNGTICAFKFGFCYSVIITAAFIFVNYFDTP